MQTIDYPKVKEEAIQLHREGKTVKEVTEILSNRYEFVENGVVVDMLPVFTQVLSE